MAKDFVLPIYEDNLVRLKETDLSVGRWESQETRDNYIAQLKYIARTTDIKKGATAWVMDKFYATYRTTTTPEHIQSIPEKEAEFKVKKWIKFLNIRDYYRKKHSWKHK